MDNSSQIILCVKLLGFLAQPGRQAEFEVAMAPGATLADVIYLIVERLGPDFRRIVLDRHGNLHGGIEVILDGQHISARKISEINVWDGGELAIMPLIAGG
jgi:hypothetical protein